MQACIVLTTLVHRIDRKGIIHEKTPPISTEERYTMHHIDRDPSQHHASHITCVYMCFSMPPSGYVA